MGPDYPSYADFSDANASDACRQGCYGAEDITVLTPYTGQLLLLRKMLEKHTLVFLDEADRKIVDDIEPSGPFAPAQDASPDASQEPVTNIRRETVRQRVRLATVDNFQGLSPRQLPNAAQYALLCSPFSVCT